MKVVKWIIALPFFLLFLIAMTIAYWHDKIVCLRDLRKWK